jgi:hypothetical protein
MDAGVSRSTREWLRALGQRVPTDASESDLEALGATEVARARRELEA